MPLLNNTNSVILSNGLKVIYHIDHCNPIISLQLHIKVGSIFEGSKEKGYSHFLEHLSFKSQGTYPSISDEVPCLGGIINAYTDFDSTCYYLMLPSEHMQRGLEILAELSCKTGFSDQDVETEKDIIIEEIKQYENEPEVDYIDYIQNHSFNNNPLKYPVLGTLDSIKNASFKSLSKFREKYYVPQNSFLTISGDLDEGTLPMNCAASFGIWKGNKPDPLPLMEKYLEPEPMQFSILTRVKQSTSGMLAVTLPELTERHQDSNLLHCAIRAWAIGKTSRLYKILVENEKLCSSVKVSSISGLLSGVSLILIYPDATHRVDRILKIVSEEYKRLLTSGLQCDEFEMVKKDIINSWRNSFESMEAHASALAVEELVYDYSRLYSYESEIGRISQADILPAIRKYWSPESVKIFIQYRSKPVNEISVCSSDFFGYSDYQPTDQKPRVTSVVRIQKYTLQDYPSFIAVNPNIFTGRLSNNLYLTYKRVPGNEFAAASLSGNVSQLMEDCSNRGINYLTSTALIHGSSYYSYEDLHKLSREHGFNIRVIQHLDSTSFRGKCPKPCFEVMLNVLSDLISSPLFKTKRLSFIKSNTIEHLKRDKDYPVAYASQQWFKMLTGIRSNLDHSSGSISSLRKICREDVQNWYQEWNWAKQFNLCIIGDFDPGWVFSLAETLFARLVDRSNGFKFHAIKALYEPSMVKFRIQRQNNEQCIINLGGFACPATNIKENTAMHLLAQILGGDLSSRFYSIIREKYAYAYQTGFDFNSTNQIGFWNAYAFCDPDDYKDTLRLMKEIITQVSSEGVSENELNCAQNYLIGLQRFDAESLSWQANTISILHALGYDLNHFLSRERRIRDVTIDDLCMVAQKYCNPESQYTHILM